MFVVVIVDKTIHRTLIVGAKVAKFLDFDRRPADESGISSVLQGLFVTVYG